MYGNRTVTVKVISEVFEENGERYTYNGNYHEAGYKLVEVDSWNCTHSFEGDDIIGYIESDPSDIVERKRLNPTNEKLLASLKTYTSDSRYKIRVGSPYVKYTGEVSDAELNELVSKYTLYVDTHNVSNETGFYPEYGADKDNDWLLASNYRCPDKDAGADADYAGFAYYRRYYAYCKDTQSWYIVGSAHNWLGCANGDTGANEFHTQEYTHTIHKYKLVESHEYTVRLNTGNIPSSELTKLTETASTEGWTWNENGRYFSKTFVQNENNYLPGVNKFFSANNYESVGSKVTDKYFVQDKAKNPTKVLYNWWTSASGGTDIGRGKKTYNNLYEISKDNSGIVNLYPHWMGYTTVFNYTDTAPSNTAGQTVTINNNINDGMDNNLYQVYGNCFFYKGTDGEYHDYEGTNPDLKVTASIPDSNGYKYIFNGWHHKNWNYLTDGLGKLTYKNNYNIGQGKTSYSLSPHFSRVGINYNVRLNANVPDTESTLQVLHQNGISSYIYNSTSRYFSRELTYDDSQDMLSPDVYSLKGYHLISRSNWYTEKTGGNTVSAPCNNTEAEYPDWTEKNWNLTTTDGATVDLYARWQANNYKIAYNLDGGTYGTSHPTSADYDTMVTIDNPSKSGYIFAGWTITGYDSTTSGHNAATWSGEKGTSYKNLTATDGSTITLYAQWKIHTHKLKVYVSNENADGSFGSEWLWQDKILEYNTPYSYTGYLNDTVYQQISTSGTMYDSDITIHLKAMRKTFNQKLTVYYEQPDGSFDAGTVVINKAYRYGQTVCWNRNADVRYKAGNISWTVAGANVKELKIYRQQYKITVNGADKHTTTKGTGTYRYGYELWITAEVEAGYHFINWNMDSSLTESSMKIEVTGDKTYTAYVEANKYLITYNLNKPARASSTPKLNTQNTWEYEYNSKILYMPDKTTTLLTGWTFEGWYTEADGGTKIKVGDIYKWIGNITLYAHWTENTYTIHYESDGGTAINDINVKYEDPVKLSAVPYRPGYIFSYWNTKADASGHSYEGSETVRHLATSGTVTLYAVWSKKAIAQIGAAVNMTEKNGYVFGHITDDSVSIRTYVIDENGNILIK